MQVVISLVGTAETKLRGRIEVPLVRVVSNHGKTHDDMDRMLEYLRYEVPMARYRLSRSENGLTFRVPLTRLNRWMLNDFRKAARVAIALNTEVL